MLPRLLLLSVLVGSVLFAYCFIFMLRLPRSFIVTTGLQIDKYAIRNARMVFQCSEAPNGILFCMNFTTVTPMNPLYATGAY